MQYAKEKSLKAIGETETKRNVLVLLTVVIIIWLANFSLSKDFGVYDDDITLVVQPMKWWFRDYLGSYRFLVSWPQGRPLFYLFGHGLAYIGNKVGGLRTIYVIAYFINVLNACLVYLLVRRNGSEIFAVVSTMIFALYPADSTHPYLTHALGLLPAVTLMLLGLLLYLSKFKWLSYLFVFLTLITQETLFFLFLGAPFLTGTWDRKTRKDFVRNALVMCAILTVVLLIRKMTGESRVEQMVSGSNYTNIFPKIFLNSLIGPATSLYALLKAPISVLRNFSGFMIVSTLIAFLIYLPLFWRLMVKPLQRPDIVDDSAQSGNPEQPGSIRWIFVGAIFLVLGYFGSFAYFPANVLLGRSTRVHIAGSMGGSLFIGALFVLLLGRIKERKMSNIFVMSGLLVYLVLLVCYQVIIQQEYVKSHEIQKWFWSNVVSLTKDAQEGTVILVPQEDLPHTKAILANSWADVFYLENIFRYPKDVYPPPRLISVDLDSSESDIVWDAEPPYVKIGDLDEVFPIVDHNVILIEYMDGKFIRKEGLFFIQGHEISLKPVESVEDLNLRPNVLYDILTLGSKQ